jgi:hypothetical protein
MNKVHCENNCARTLFRTVISWETKGNHIFENLMLEKRLSVKIRALELVVQGFPGNNCLKIGSQ